MEAAVLFVSESERDAIYDLISTNRPGRHSAGSGGEAFSTPFLEIDSVRLLGE